MKTAKIGLTLAVAIWAAPALADPVEGTWKTQVDDGAYAHIVIAPCADRYCGEITRTFNSDGEYKSKNIGRQLVWDMVAQGNGRYAKGKIWQPSTDKIFNSKMTLDGDTLFVSGCVAILCKKQTWSRVSN